MPSDDFTLTPLNEIMPGLFRLALPGRCDYRFPRRSRKHEVGQACGREARYCVEFEGARIEVCNEHRHAVAHLLDKKGVLCSVPVARRDRPRVPVRG